MGPLSGQLWHFSEPRGPEIHGVNRALSEVADAGGPPVVRGINQGLIAHPRNYPALALSASLASRVRVGLLSAAERDSPERD